MDAESQIHPLVLLFVLLMGLLVLMLPRRHAILPVLVVGTLIPLGQSVVLAGLHFYMLRIILPFAWLRVLLRGEYRLRSMHPVDKLLIAYVLSGIMTYVLLRQSYGAFENRMGQAYNAVGIYFLARWLVPDADTWKLTLKTLAIISVTVASAMLVELATGRNFFSVMGGVPEFTEIRDGSLRCQGPFLHPILAGIFGATIMPLFLSMRWMEQSHNILGTVAIAASVTIVATSASSAPALSLLAAVVALGAWSIRRHMRAVRWAILLSILFLHMIMNAPVWALIGRLSVFQASTGYHRYNLLDHFIRRVDEWWLLGTQSNAAWDIGLWDATNMYVRVGLDGGLITLALFVAMIVLLYRSIGRTIRLIEPSAQRILWSLGASLFGHVVGFFGVAYFDQLLIIWYVLMATIVTLTITPPGTVWARPKSPAVLPAANIFAARGLLTTRVPPRDAGLSPKRNPGI